MPATSGCFKRASVREDRERIANDIAWTQVVYKTSLPRLDRALGGGRYPKRVFALIGRIKSDETASASTIVFNLYYAGAKRLYNVGETGAEQIEQRRLPLCNPECEAAGRTNASFAVFRGIASCPWQSFVAQGR